VSEESRNFSAGAQALVNDAQRLGLTWDLRPATVGSTDPLQVTVDADTIPINATSMVGVLTAGRRVYVLLIPPSGVFIVGFNDPAFTSPLGITTNLNQAGTAGNTTSATFVDVPGSPTLSITKKYPASLTHIKATLSIGAFSSAVNTGVAFALLISSVDRQILGSLLINTANAHTYFSGTILLTGLPVGVVTAVIRWRRVSGAGLVQIDGNDWTSLTFDEVWAV